MTTRNVTIKCLLLFILFFLILQCMQHFVYPKENSSAQDKNNEINIINDKKDEEESETECHPRFARKPVHIGGSGRNDEFRWSFDFSSPPGSVNRVSPRKMHYQSEDPVVTIITAANNPVYINETARCLFDQSLQLFEWIIVNDHSDTETVLGEYRNHNDSRVKVVDCDSHTSTPCGLPRARNIGLGYAKTEFIVFLDDDDLLDSTYLEKLLWFLESNPEFSYVNSYSIAFEAKTYLWSHTFYESSLKENKQTVTAMIRTEALRKIAGRKWPHALEEERIGGGEDWVMWLSLKNIGLHGATIPEYMFWYRMKSKRRKWDFLNQASSKGKTKGNNLFQKTGSSSKVVPLSYKVGQKKFPDLYDSGFANPVIEERIKKGDCLRELPFSNVQISDYTLPHGCSDMERRIILVTPWLGSSGADAVNVKLIQLLSEKNWRVTVVNALSPLSGNTMKASWEFYRPIVQQYTEDIFTLPHFLRVKDYARFLLYLIRSRSANVFMTLNSTVAYNLLPYLKTHSHNVVFADIVHERISTWDMSAIYEEDFPRLSATFSKYLDISIFASNKDRTRVADIIGLSRPRDNQIVVHRGFDMDKMIVNEKDRQLSRGDMGLNEDTLCLVYAGRLGNLDKRQSLLVIFNNLLQQLRIGSKRTAHLLIAGEGDVSKDMKSFISNNNLKSKITMFGKVNRQVLNRIFSVGDVLFMPSLKEGLSVTALAEAMGLGLVPVVTDVGDHSEIVREECGCLLKQYDDKGLLQCLVRLAVEPHALKRMSINSKSVVERKFSFGAMQDKLHGSLVHAFDALEKDRFNGDIAVDKLKSEEELTKVLKYINSTSPKSGTLVGTLGEITVPARETEFGRELAGSCAEDSGMVTSWITRMETAKMCKSPFSSVLAAYAIGDHIKVQCGQWCVFNVTDPDNVGWFYNPGRECFLKFQSKKKKSKSNHICHSYTDLKEKLKD